MLASGKVFKYGDNIDTDVIIPARYLNTPDMKELASHCMEDIEKFEQIIFEETTTIGIRKQKMKMTMLKTELKIIDTYLGKAQVKICDLKNEKRIYPEHNSIVEICEKSGKSYQEIYQFIVNEYKKLGGI